MKVRNKAIVVTGGGNGIGRELVLNLLSKGARVAAVVVPARPGRVPLIEPPKGAACTRAPGEADHSA